MARGYWLPPMHHQLLQYNGFYVDNSAIYANDDLDAGWNRLLDRFGRLLPAYFPRMMQGNFWAPTQKTSRYVLAYDRRFQIILETLDDYTAFFLIVPESCTATKSAIKGFEKALHQLQTLLTTLYPGHVRRRVNTWRAELVG